MEKKLILSSIIFIILLVILFFLWYFIGRNASEKNQVTVVLEKGDLNITITSTGELEAKSSENIYGPAYLKDVGIWQIKINDLIPEGSRVKKGDYVASLDPSEISNKIKELQADIDKNRALFNKTQLDTTLDLRNERDKLAALKFSLEEDQVTLDQSKYEPPAVIRQAEIELEKVKRSYTQALKNYKLKQEQDIIKMQEINTVLNNSKPKLEFLSKALNNLSIRAPKDGILIYKRGKGNEKISSGSVISIFNNIIATIPDLSQITSRTYINETDISKVKEGMPAEVYVDALPDKKISAKVFSVSSIGEHLPNSDLNVFEVRILIDSADAELKPSMTTKNVLLINTFKDVLHLPIECIHNENNITFVYKKESFGIVKAEVQIGQSNDDDIIITKGLNQNDIIFLTIPDNANKLDLVKL